MTPLVILALTFAIPVVMPVATRLLGRDAGWVAAALLGALTLYAWFAVPAGTTATVPWMPGLGIELSLHIDGLARMFGILVLGVGAVVMAYSSRYLGRGQRHTSYYALMTFFAAAMLGLVWADDVVLLFVMWELTTFCSFFLICQAGPKGTPPAIRTLLITVAGGLCLLGAVALMAVRVGSTQITEIVASPLWTEDRAFTVTIAVLVAIAAFTKSAQFPFQSWLADAMVAATPVSAYLHAAAMVKAGIYLALRFSAPLHDEPVWNILLITCGLTTAVLGAVFALQRHDLKELLAYSTISQLGFLIATIGVGTEYAMIAACVHVIAHALFKSSLFMFVGVIDHQAGSRDMRKLPTLWRVMPGATIAIGLAAASMAGIPPLLGFVSKEWMFKSLVEAPGPAWTGPVVGILAVGAAICTFAYSARFVLGGTVYDGHPATDEPAQRPDGDVTKPSLAFLLPSALPAYLGVVFGFTGFLLAPLVGGAARDAIGAGDPVGASGSHVAGSGEYVNYAKVDLGLWHGVNIELAMSAAVIVLGAVLVVARRPVERFLDRELAPLRGNDVVESLRNGFIAFGARVGDLTRTDSMPRHLGYILVALLAVGTLGLVTIGELPPVEGELTRSWDWPLVALVALGTIGLVIARSRLAAVTSVGIVGFAVALWFFTLGAVDVALTQLLVEVLTVVVIVFVLQRLPRIFHEVPRSRTVASAVIAIGVGVISGLGVWALTGRRELSEVGEHFLVNAEEDTGGINVVNTVLVDYRALDTLGELTVLGLCGVAIVLALHARRALPRRSEPLTVPDNSPLLPAGDNGVFLRTLAMVLGPLIVLLSLFFLVRGHNAPGGGFNSALIGGAGIALYYLRAPRDADGRLRVPYVGVIGAGVTLGTVTGLLGFVDGSFLLPLHAYLGDVHLTTALVFDVGVYLAVIGVVMAAVDLLGRDPEPEQEPTPDPDTVPPYDDRVVS